MKRLIRLRKLVTALIMAGLSLVALTGASLAQQADPAAAAILVADDVRLTGDDQLIASGNVEVMYDGRRLQAREIIYDRENDQLILTGPITITEAGETMVLASSGAMDRDMHNGLLRGARVVFDAHTQIAANELARVNGRYNQLYKASVTSCRVCDSDKPPLWQIRARRIVHDEKEKQLYFDNAQFRVLDTPIFYLPRLRLPDPTLERATGFLVPSLHNSSLLGFGVRVPYFIKIGDHKDLTLTPYWSTKSRTLEFRYRQAFRTGRIEFSGAVSSDDISTRDSRAYIFGNGEFLLQRDFVLRFDIEAVNDNSYLVDYAYSDKDRLDSEIEIERVRRDEYIRAAITQFHTLRPGEANSTLPTTAFNGEIEQRYRPGSLGGELRLGLLSHGHIRSSNLISDGPDFDPFADGRDVGRLGVSLDWHRNWTLPGGVLAHFQTGVAVDTFHINQSGATSSSSATEVTPSTSVVLRWPLVKSASNGASHVIEPAVQLSWVGGDNPNIPNDESTRIEFDEGNLFAISRFSAPDRRERGLSATYGITWTRFAPKGWQTSFAVGQVVRKDRQLEVNGLPSFTNTSGLRGKYTDVLVAGQLKTSNGLIFTARSLFDGAFDTTKAEARASWRNDLAKIGATYIWLRDDLAENRPGTISEWAFDASYRLSRHWTGNADWRYDIASDRSVRAGLGVIYTNECVDIELSASRRFTSSTILAPSTDISFTVGLRGFTTKTRDKSYVRTCRK